MMQQEVIAHNNERARIAEQSRQAEAAARQASDIQEDKMQELMTRLDDEVDDEVKYRARLEAENADLRARSELPVHPTHIGTPPGLPDTNRDSTTGDRLLSGLVSTTSSRPHSWWGTSWWRAT